MFYLYQNRAMQKLWLFFLRFNSIFIFLLLEIIALSIYFSRNNTAEKSAFLSSANGLVGNIYDYSNRLSRYWKLSSVNDSLAKENARLRMKLPSSQFSHLVQTSTVRDTLLQQQFRYIEAAVVNNTINRPSNFLTVNRGRTHGVRPNCGVISAVGEGVVGVVRRVSSNYSVITSILNRDIRISAKVARNNYFGILSWDGNSVQHLLLEGVPKHAVVEKGDTIVTSGFSTMFPAGIMVGTVDTGYIEPGSNFYTAQVRLSADMSNMQYVHIVDDLFRNEREALEKEEGK